MICMVKLASTMMPSCRKLCDQLFKVPFFNHAGIRIAQVDNLI